MKRRTWWVVLHWTGEPFGIYETRRLARHWRDHVLEGRIVRVVEVLR